MEMERVYFSKSKKGDGVICRTRMGKVSFIDRCYKGTIPREGEEWAVEIVRELEKVNILRPCFRIDESTPVNKLLEVGFVLRLDLFNEELVIYGKDVYGRDKEFRRIPYDGRWDNETFFSDYSIPEAIQLHKLSKKIVESGKTAIVVDNNGRLVQLPPSSVEKNFHEYGYFCHIHEVRGDEKNFAFVNKEAEEKWNQLLEKTKQEFFSQEPLPGHWNNKAIARSLGIPDRQVVEVPVSQKVIGCSNWAAYYHEVVATADVDKYRHTPIVAETICQVCGSTTEMTVESSYTVYYERGMGYFDRDVGSATHKGLGQCPHCGAVQDNWWGEEGREITALPNFTERDGARANWQDSTEEEVYCFPYEDEDLMGELVVTILPKTGATYLQKYKIWKVKSLVMRVFKVKGKCMIPNFLAVSPLEDGSSEYIRAAWERCGKKWVQMVDFENSEFPTDFSLAERSVCGWLPQGFYYKEKEGAYLPKEIHSEICGYLADVGEYFLQDVPKNIAMVKSILDSMVAADGDYIEFLPSEKEIKSLYPFFKEDWVAMGGDKDGFPSELEWSEK